MQRVLIVEPDEHIAKQIKMLAAQSGFEMIEWVEDEKEAISKVDIEIDSVFDLIISEWQLMDMNALTFFEELKVRATGKKIYFMIVSANASVEQVKLAAKAGVYAYILKPIDSKIMIKRMSSIRHEVSHARLF